MSGGQPPTEYDGKYAIGGWGYTTDLNDLSEMNRDGNPIKRDGTYGLYGLIEQVLYHEKEHLEQGLTLFVRAGVADPRVNRFSQYYSGGLTYKGLVPGRDFDWMGVGVAAARHGSHFQRAQRKAGQSVDDAEIALEFTYAMSVLPKMVIQPDVQYIINPDTNPTVRNALVLGVRVQLHMNWFEDALVSGPAHH